MTLLPGDHRPTSGRTVRPAVAEPTTERPVRPPAPRVPAPLILILAGLLLTGLLVAALLVGGGRPVAPTPGLADAGPLTGWGRPLVDLLTRLLAVLTVGQLAYAALLAPGSPTAPAGGAVRALRGTTWSAAGWLVAEVGALVLTASSLYGVPVTGLSLQSVLDLATQLPTGRASVWVAALITVVLLGSARLAACRRGPIRSAAAVLLLAALVAVIVPVVLTGHSAAADDHVPAVLALSVHVVSASLWVGGLAGLLLHGRDRSEAVPAVHRFSALALACVVLLLVSGAVAAVLVAGAPSWSWTSQGWVTLLVVKTALLALLAAIGWWHRRRTLPALTAGRPGAFVGLGVVEVALMAITLTLSVALAASPAPQPSIQATNTAPVGSTTALRDDDTDPASTPPRDDTTEVEPQGAVDSGVSRGSVPAPVEDMSGHDHGELSVAVLVDEDRFHVAGTVRPGQTVTVYNTSDSAATITALDGSFNVDVPARTLLTFPAPVKTGSYDFVSRAQGSTVDGFADTLQVRATP